MYGEGFGTFMFALVVVGALLGWGCSSACSYVYRHIDLSVEVKP